MLTKKRGRPSRASERIAAAPGPTAETVAKLESDALLDLVQRGDLTVEQERAAREINAVWEALEQSISRTSILETLLELRPISAIKHSIPQPISA